MNKYLQAAQITKLKNLKDWAHSNLPKTFRPAIDYTLGWLSPDLLGTGFSIEQQMDSQLVAKIPAKTVNKDFQNQIHHGLVINAGIEMIRLLLNKHIVGSGYILLNTEINLNKKLNWSTDLTLKMNVDLEFLEANLIEFQKNTRSEFEFKILINNTDSNKSDSVNYKIRIQKIELLAQDLK